MSGLDNLGMTFNADDFVDAEQIEDRRHEHDMPTGTKIMIALVLGIPAAIFGFAVYQIGRTK